MPTCEVFRCPHPLATMSIEEAADLEIQEMREKEVAWKVQLEGDPSNPLVSSNMAEIFPQIKLEDFPI
jgi:hypothetical protein